MPHNIDNCMTHEAFRGITFTCIAPVIHYSQQYIQVNIFINIQHLNKYV